MARKKQLATRGMSLLLFAGVSLLALVSQASGSAVKAAAPQPVAKKSPEASSPAFPPHYFDRSTPPLTIRHVQSTERDLHPPPPPGRHSRLHHPHFPPSSLRRRPSQGGETAPPYAVQMEPLVKYSPRDPLYEGGSEERKEEARGAEEEPPQSLDGEEDAEDLEGGAATLRSLHAEDKSSSGHPVHHYPTDDPRRVPYQFQSSLYGSHHGQHSFPQGPRYIILREPEPIIEIIVKESNHTLPAPVTPAVIPQKPREPVHVFYVKYERKKGKSGGERVVFEPPVPAKAPSSPEPLPHVYIPEETEVRSPAVVTLPTVPISVETTTLRAVIHPESETVHHPHSHAPALRVTFGEEHAHSKDGEVVEEEQSAPQPSFASPSWGGARPSPVPPFRQLPEQHFRGHQGASRYFGPPPQHQQYGHPNQGQFPQQQLREGQSPDSRAFPDLSRLPPNLSHQPLGQNSYSQGIRGGQGHPPTPYRPEIYHQQQQALLRQQQLQQFQQQQHQQKHALQLQEQQKQHNQQFHRLPNQLPSRIPPHHSPHSVPSSQPTPQLYQQHSSTPHASTHSPFIRLPNRHGERFPEPSGTPATGGDIIQSITHSEQHQFQSPTSQAHLLNVGQQERNQLPKGQPTDQQFIRNNQPGSIPQLHQQQRQQQQHQHQQQQHQQQQQQQKQQQQQQEQQQQQQQQQYLRHQQQQAQGSLVAANRPQNPTIPTPILRQHIGGQQQTAHFSVASPSSNGAIQQHQQKTGVTPSPTPGQQYGTTVLHYPTDPPNTIKQINSLGNPNEQRGAPSTTPQPSSSTTPTPDTTTRKIPDLPDEIPDDLRQQLLSSGILDNADIQILDYDKVGDIPIESLPPEALAGLQGAASENKPVSVEAPKRKEAVEMKVVRYTPGNEEVAVDGLIRDDVEETRVLAPVTTSQETPDNEEGFRRYLPLRISGERFPVPDVPELRGRNVTSVVVLAPVGFPDNGRGSRVEGDAEERSDDGKVLTLDRLNVLVKNPSGENFKEWLEAEKKASPEEQAVVLLVSPKDGQPEEKGDIFMMDVTSGQVSQLRGELSAAFVQVAKTNAKDSGLEQTQ